MMKRLVETIITIIIIACIACGAIYAYKHNENVQNLYDEQEKRIEQEQKDKDDTKDEEQDTNKTKNSANSVKAVSAFASKTEQKQNNSKDTDQKFYYVYFPLENLGMQYLVCDSEDNFLNLEIRQGADKYWQNVDCQIEIQFYPDDKEKRFVYIVDTQIKACSWYKSKHTFEMYFNGDYEFKFANKEHYNILKNDRPNYRILIRGANNHSRTCHMKKIGKFTQYLGMRHMVWATYSPDYSVSTIAKTTNPTDVSGVIVKPEDPDTQPPDGKNPKDDWEIWFEKVFDFINYRFNSLNFPQKIVRIFLYVVIVTFFLIILSYIMKALKFAFGKD